jgi:hypothetical protein
MALDTLDELALHCMETNGGVDTKNNIHVRSRLLNLSMNVN